jgi:hypothetical protein
LPVLKIISALRQYLSGAVKIKRKIKNKIKIKNSLDFPLRAP